MTTVIKRSGREEPFDIDKIKHTLAAASDELKQPLNAGNLKMISEGIAAKVSGVEKISSREIFEHVIALLREEGFTSLANSYESNMRNHYKA